MPAQDPSVTNASDVVDSYIAPTNCAEADVSCDNQEPLADRSSRLAAIVIDVAILLIPYLILAKLTKGQELGEASPFGYGSLSEQFLQAAAYIAVWAVVNLHFLRRGQTIGKRAMKIQIVDFETGRIPNIFTLVLLRTGLIALVCKSGIGGGVLGLIDALMIFGEERRCLHDYLAKTKVIKVSGKP